MTAPTFDELFDVARDEVLARNGDLTLAVVEREGSDANLMVAAQAAVGDAVIGQLLAVTSALFLDSARGEALRRLVLDRYGIPAKGAAPSFGVVQFTTTVGAPVTFSIPAGTQVQTSDGRVFVTLATVTYPGGSVGPVNASVRSVLAGLSQRIRPGAINAILSAIVNKPDDLEVTNAVASSGGDDEELDDDLRYRARRFFVTARRGTLAALEAGALAVPGVRRATAIEAIDALGRPAGMAEVIVADAFTEDLVGVNPTPAGYATQSQALAAAVTAALEEVRAAGVYVRAYVAHVVLQTIVLALTFQAGVDTEAVALAARSLVVAAVNGLRPGEPLNRGSLVDVLRMVNGLVITGDEVVSPPGNVFVPTLAVLRTRLAGVSAISVSPAAVLQATTASDGVV